MVAVGGGGLISGVAAYIKALKPSVCVVGCLPEKNACMYHSVKAGKILADGESGNREEGKQQYRFENGDTISDGTAGGIDEGSVTFDTCKSLVDKWVLVCEKEIKDGVWYAALLLCVQFLGVNHIFHSFTGRF
jgi:threonine dehydratase